MLPSKAIISFQLSGCWLTYNSIIIENKSLMQGACSVGELIMHSGCAQYWKSTGFCYHICQIALQEYLNKLLFLQIIFFAKNLILEDCFLIDLRNHFSNALNLNSCLVLRYYFGSLFTSISFAFCFDLFFSDSIILQLLQFHIEVYRTEVLTLWMFIMPCSFIIMSCPPW